MSRILGHIKKYYFFSAHLFQFFQVGRKVFLFYVPLNRKRQWRTGCGTCRGLGMRMGPTIRGLGMKMGPTLSSCTR